MPDIPNPPVDRPYRFIDGPWADQVRYQPRAAVPQHCMPNADGGAVWAAADSWRGKQRYVPDGNDGDAVRMVWRHATYEEIVAAEHARCERYADKQWGDDE